METISSVSKQRFENVLREIRRDIARLHRDLAGAAGNESNWILVLMWITFSNFLLDAFELNALLAIVISAFLVGAYSVIEATRIRKRAMQQLNEPVEPMWDTEVKL